MTTAALCANTVVPEACRPSAPKAAVRIARTAGLFAMLWLVFIPEYAQGSAGSLAKSSLYYTVRFGLRVIDILVLGAGMAAAFVQGCSRTRLRYVPRELVVWLGLFGAAICISLVYGAQRGGHNFFFDWRALALGVAFYFIYRFWIATPADAKAALLVLAVTIAIHLSAWFLGYARGAGDSLLGVRIPLFDGPSLSAIVFASILGISLATRETAPRLRFAWLLFSGSAMLFVALCFRRTYWAELTLGLVLLALGTSQQKLRILALPILATVLAFLVLGGPLLGRLSSIDFTREDAPYGEDNADHVGDVLDAWAQVRASPVMGIGLGRSYETWHIREWKDESVMVHNAALHVWVKYGLLGLAVYFGYHLSLFGLLRSQAKRSPPFHGAVINAALAYLAAQFTVSLGFTPWPYSAVQSTNLIAFLLAVSFVREPACHSQAFRLSPRPSTAALTWKTQSPA